MGAAGLRPLDQTLDVCAAELAELARMADRLQTTVAVLSAGAPRVELLTECQSADLLYQRIAGLAVFMARLAGVAPNDTLIDAPGAAGCLPLADQAVRLGGLRRVGDQIPHPAPSGDMELFDG